MTGKDEWRLIHINGGVLTDSVTTQAKTGQRCGNPASTIAGDRTYVSTAGLSWSPGGRSGAAAGGVTRALNRRPSDHAGRAGRSEQSQWSAGDAGQRRRCRPQRLCRRNASGTGRAWRASGHPPDCLVSRECLGRTTRQPGASGRLSRTTLPGDRRMSPGDARLGAARATASRDSWPGMRPDPTNPGYNIPGMPGKVRSPTRNRPRPA